MQFLRAVSHGLGAGVPCDEMEQSDSDDVPTASSNVAPSAAVQTLAVSASSNWRVIHKMTLEMTCSE